MRKNMKLIVMAGLVLVSAAGAAWAQSRPVHQVPPGKNGDLVVALCDGQTTVEVAGVKPGETLPHEKAQAVSDELMHEWRAKNPHANWQDDERLAQNGPGGAVAVVPPPSPGPAPSPATRQGQAYGSFTDRDEAIWKASTDAFIEQGNRIFHDAGLLGGTIGVSCDMCHPNAANTHPETYPKYQVQLGRVALLRDMINWCVENPVRGKPLADDDPKMKALEAYILAQRKGVALEYGKH